MIILRPGGRGVFAADTKTPVTEPVYADLAAAAGAAAPAAAAGGGGQYLWALYAVLVFAAGGGVDVVATRAIAAGAMCVVLALVGVWAAPELATTANSAASDAVARSGGAVAVAKSRGVALR